MSTAATPIADSNDLNDCTNADDGTTVPEKQPLPDISPTKPVGFQAVYDRRCGNGTPRRRCEQCAPPSGEINKGRHDTGGVGGDWIDRDGSVKRENGNPKYNRKYPDVARQEMKRSDTEDIENDEGEEEDTYGNISHGAPRTWFNPDDADFPNEEIELQFQFLQKRHNDNNHTDIARAVKNIASKRQKRSDKELTLKEFAERTLPPSLTDEVMDIFNSVNFREGKLRNRSTEQIIVAICLVVIDRHQPEEGSSGYTEIEIEEIQNENEQRIEDLRKLVYEEEGKDNGNEITADALGEMKEEIEQRLDT